MQIQARNLGVFVPALYSVPDNPIWPGMAGLAEFVPGKFPVPENPVIPGLAGLADFVDGSFSLPQNPVIDGLGDVTPTGPMYPLHTNSVLEWAKRQGLAGLGCGSGCSGGCGCKSGMSGITEDVTQWAESTWTDIKAGGTTTWLALGGAALLGFFLFGHPGSSGSEYRRAKTAARDRYRRDLARVKEQYPTAARRVYRGAAAARGAF